MKRVAFLLLFTILNLQMHAQCVRDTFTITKISCYDSLGVIAPAYSLPKIQNQGLSFSIDTLYVNVGDSVNFQIGATHNVVEVSQSTWLSNGTTSNGGFSTNFGGGMIAINSIGIHYYVCQPHAALGMKAIIIATNNPFSYNWYNASNTLVSTNDSLISDTCGPFYVKVFDNNGVLCDSANRFLGCPLGIVEGQKNIECFGDSSGELIRYGFSGSPSYFYSWYKDDILFSTGIDDTIQTNLSAGLYKVVVTDSIGCLDSIITNFNNPPQLLFHSIAFDSILCNGNTTQIEVMVKGGRKYTNGKQYAYYFIRNTDTIAYSNLTGQSLGFSATSPDTSYLDTVYISNINASVDSLIIIVVDSFGCATDSTIFISQPDSIVAQIYLNTYPICSYDSTWIYLDSISGGVGPYTFQWTDGSSSDSIYVAGGYNRVFVTDLNGCLDSTNGIDVITPHAITVSDSIIHVKCNGDTTGQIYLQTSGGTGTITTDWGLGINPLALNAGTYPVLINDSLGCLYPNSAYIITENPLINTSFNSKNPTCLNHANGSILANVVGGVLPYSLLWSNGSTLDSLLNLQVGWYSLFVTDLIGCERVDSVLLQSTDSLIISFANYTSSLSCFGELTAITANISGGTTSSGDYNILWGNGDTTNQTILGGGTHQILVSDDVGCEDSATVFIASPNPLTVDTNATNPSCLGNDGIIDIVINGGTLPYEILWSTGENSTSIDSLVDGTYWVIVVDSCGIKDSLAVELAPYISNLNIDNVNLIQPSCSDTDGVIDITVSGGFTPLTYDWNNGAITEDLSGVAYGNYTVLITDNCGLKTTATYTLNQMTNTVSANGFYDYLSLWSAVTVNGAYPPFSVNWTSISITGDSIQGLCEGNYPITVIDSENCEDTFSIDVLYNVNQLVDAAISTVIDTSWGIGPFLYLWNDGQTTPTADSLCEGLHSVTVTDGSTFACEFSESFTIDPLSVILHPDVSIVDCEDDFDGTIIVNPSGGTPNYRFLWSTGDTLDRLDDNLNPGTYYVSMYDKNGCQIDTSIQISAIGTDCIPNVFSPNGDNVNDVWELEDSFLYDESTITIYGRFGKKMYESVGYNTPWNGTNKKGNAVPDGAYFYVITLKGSIDPIRGTITIIR
ncbi:MAG: gliding motility-associated C-terminal domain-containing protein [Bacteroidota bacterium]|nr:gliding motility-associated C-terminal domain-containing protein [Bacteroidota bacterium]